jgi:hypothetical protein
VAETAKPHGGGNLKYIIGGVVLLLGAVVIWLVTQKTAQAPAPPAPAPEPPKSAERVNPLAEPELILDEVKDAGQPVEEPAADKPKKVVRARDEWDCQGDLARASLQTVIDSNRAQVRSCYERRLKTNNVLAGDLKLKIRVAPNGHVTATQVGGSLKDNEVFGCVRNIASKWTFPPPENGCAVVQVPFQFAPKTN